MANVLGALFGDIAEAIREKTGDTEKMKPAEFPEKISGISTGADVSGVTAAAEDVLEGKVFVDAQGNEVVGTLVVEEKSSDDTIWNDFEEVGSDSASGSLAGSGIIRYVTFKSYDGAISYGQKSVIAGDDCVDPVAGGYMDTPTRESDVQYDYTFSGGWATEPGGGIDADALKNVTEDRTVYANFIAAVRYYTITYYDSDGATVLKTESLAYGVTPAYAPTSDDYMFAGWVPELTTVTGDASYTASWKEKPAFATATWAEIKEIADAGLASAVFSVGDSRTDTMTFTDGTTEEVTWVIADMDAENGYEGNSFYNFFDETPHIALVAGHAIAKAEKRTMHTSAYVSNYVSTSLYNYVNGTLKNALSEDMRNVLKDIYWVRSSNGTGTACKLALPHADSLGYNTLSGSAKFGAFELFNSNANRIRTMGANGEATPYWTSYRSSSSTSAVAYFAYIDETGAAVTSNKNTMYILNNTYAVVPMCFI